MANLSNISNKFIVTDGGNVLIGGNISGSSILQVTGDVTISNDSNALLTLSAGSSDTCRIDYLENGTTKVALRNSLGAGAFDDFGIFAGSATPIWNNDNLRLAIKGATGNVGIGTDSPADKLTVNGNIITQGGSTNTGYDRYLKLYGNTAPATNTHRWAGLAVYNNGGNNVNELAFFTGSGDFARTEKMRITSGGNVLIGTTSAENPRGLAKVLEIEAGDACGIILNDSRDSHPMGIENAGAVMNFTYNTSPLMTILTAGNVGIGTTSPDTKLEIEGITRISSSTGNSYLELNDTRVGGSRWQVLSGYPNAGNFGLYDIAGVDYRFVIDNIGNVGIGTTSPRADSFTRGLTIGNTSDGAAQLVLQENTLTGGWRIFNNGYLGFIANNYERMRITSGGVVEVGGNSVQSVAKLNTRVNGSAIEFGHTNNGDWYFGTLGSYGSAGNPFLGFSTWCESSLNTWTTKGVPANIIKQESNGNLSFQQISATNSTGQTPVTVMELYAGGRLHPSQGVFLGSSNNSNLLDDYEEGTWTPVIGSSGGMAATATFYSPKYTKIGQLVHCVFYAANISVSSMTSGDYIQLQGLPFAASSYGDFTIAYKSGTWTGGNIIGGYIQSGVNYVYFMRADGTEARRSGNPTMTKMMFNCTYTTDS